MAEDGRQSDARPTPPPGGATTVAAHGRQRVWKRSARVEGAVSHGLPAAVICLLHHGFIFFFSEFLPDEGEKGRQRRRGWSMGIC